MDVDEMKLIKEFSGSAPLPDRNQLVPARNRLIVAAAEERTGSAPAMRSRGRRWAWSTGLTVGLAAAISGVLVLTPAGEVGGGAPVANAEAAQVLRSAADAALKLPDAAPRPDQFVYLRSETPDGPREAWLSADGTREGVYVQGGENPGTVPACQGSTYQDSIGTPQEAGNCTPEAGYRPGLPTEADAMLEYLKNPENAKDPNVVSSIRRLATESYMRPESRAALFEAAAEIPGITVVPDAKDPSGRSGIGISFPSPDGTPQLLIFDPTSYAFLGTENYAQLEVAFTDQPGHRP
ncbi:CU044_5270 family protein [Saccharopolyspora indica]|uniref:CU044_5270 family protein n=1 Tax=Saccharopolyspora indica TaxID=1229659 RepID=UPI0022EB195F|nr:CU044_5270 family protein [Saccharopolyspora indica]MDA3645847.1 CU044_5270 family protein [Saccharopolyspora indica]